MAINLKILKILALQSANSITETTKIGKYQTQELFFTLIYIILKWNET